MVEKIVIFDDHPLILEGIQSYLTQFSDKYEIVGVYKDCENILTRIGKAQPDVIILDISFGEANSINICKDISQKFPLARIIGFSGHEEAIIINNFLDNGAKGYVLKSEGTKAISEAIETTRLGQVYLCPKSKIAIDAFKKKTGELPKLTRREKDIIKLIKSGKTINDIAEELFISTNTVVTHRKNILSKFEANNMMSVISIVGHLL